MRSTEILHIDDMTKLIDSLNVIVFDRKSIFEWCKDFLESRDLTRTIVEYTWNKWI